MALSDMQLHKMTIDDWQMIGQSSQHTASSVEDKMKDEECVVIVDKQDRKWRALLTDCVSIESTKAMIAKELGIVDPILSIDNSLILGSMWTSRVKNGVEIRIHSMRATSSQPARPITGPRSSGIPILNFPTQDLYEAKGFFRLPFFGCTDRVYEFLGGQAGLAELEIYRKLRENAPPERWSDLNGEVCTHGVITGLELPEVKLGKVIGGRLNQLQFAKRGWYVVIWKAKVHIPKGECSHNLDGDVVYKWIRYASGDRARSSLQEAFGQGFGIVAAWAEIESDDSAVPAYLGRNVANDFFAVVDAKPREMNNGVSLT